MLKKCTTCKKKLPLVSLTCKCGLEFCSLHRLAESHNCTFNYRLVEKDKLSKLLLNSGPTKINKI